MLLRNAKQDRKATRALPVGTIITRFRSAQQKQQLEMEKLNEQKAKNKSPNVNSVLKPVSQPTTSKSDKPTETVNTKKPDMATIEKTEYYPNKLKRKVLNARIYLSPKPCLKVICGTKGSNKRKLHLPRKDMKYVNEQKIQEQINFDRQLASELTIIDMIRYVEDSGNFDDEDMLEVITCPSPVWWEPPPEGYREEALYSQPRRVEPEPMTIRDQLRRHKLAQIKEGEERRKLHMKKYERMKARIQKDNDRNLIKSLNINMESRDKTFINKRSKLETLLGNIKNKTTDTPNRYKKIKKVSDNNKVGHMTNENVDKTAMFPKDNDVQNKFNEQRSSELTDEDLLEFKDDYILKHLENVDIPIEATQNQESNKNLKKSVGKKRRVSIQSNLGAKNISMECYDLSLSDDDDDDKCNVAEETKVTYYENKVVDEIKMSEAEKRRILDKMKVTEEENEIIVIDDDDDDLVIVGEIKKDVDENDVLPGSPKPSTSGINCPVDEFGTIDELNQNYFLEDTYVENKKKANFKTLDIIKEDENTFDESDSDLVTIYQIVNDNESTELNNSPKKPNYMGKLNIVQDDNNKIHRFYKGQKFFKSNRNVDMDTIKIEVDQNTETIDVEQNAATIDVVQNAATIEAQNQINSMLISRNDQIKYCFMCSAIFDSDQCNYCLRKNLKRKYEDDEFKCENCGSFVNSQQEMTNHLNDHTQCTHNKNIN